MFDTHVHANFSTDSHLKIEEILLKEKESSLSFVITEHADLDYKDELKFKFNPRDYFKTFGKYRSESLLLGAEIGISPSLSKENSEFLSPFPFDMVIGSVHLIDGYDLYTKEIYSLYKKRDLYEKYLMYIRDSVKSHSFINTLGHIDYITRYARYKDREMKYEDFSDYIDEVLKEIIENEIALEINTRRFNEEEGRKNYLNIIKRYKELGGDFVTIGSDAHHKENLGVFIQYAYSIAKSIGLMPVYFKEGKMEKEEKPFVGL